VDIGSLSKKSANQETDCKCNLQIVNSKGNPTMTDQQLLDELTTAPTGPRALHQIARDIKRDWRKCDPKTGYMLSNVYFGAAPYLDAMGTLDGINDSYGCDSARNIVAYFLANASTWRGDAAKRIKAELNAMLKGGR
jgi:hypothetical protein